VVKYFQSLSIIFLILSLSDFSIFSTASLLIVARTKVDLLGSSAGLAIASIFEKSDNERKIIMKEYVDTITGEVNISKSLEKTIKEKYADLGSDVIYWYDLGKFYGVFKNLYSPVMTNIISIGEVNKVDSQRTKELVEFLKAQESEAKNNRVMNAALSTALVGIQRGFWRNENNPVISQLVTSLSSAGFANPEPLVAQAFANQGESLFKTVMAKALELMQKPVEVQNELAASISGMGSVTDVDANVEDRLANVGNIVQGQTVVAQQIESQSSATRVDFSERARMHLRRINGLA
jgi:hypothetical protein